MCPPDAHDQVAAKGRTVPIVCGILSILAAGDSESGRSHAQSAAPGGVVVTYRAGNAAADTSVLPGLALYVAAGSTPTPFLPPGPFTAEIDGQLSVDLRDDYQFRAELSGSARITIGEAVVLTAAGPGAPAGNHETHSSQPRTKPHQSDVYESAVGRRVPAPVLVVAGHRLGTDPGTGALPAAGTERSAGPWSAAAHRPDARSGVPLHEMPQGCRRRWRAGAHGRAELRGHRSPAEPGVDGALDCRPACVASDGTHAEAPARVRSGWRRRHRRVSRHSSRLAAD